MADVFLSYSSKDRPAAERVQKALEHAGIDVFWDQETPPGVDWDTWIRSKLSNAKAAVVLWSKASIASPNVRHEAIVARDAGKLVPVMIETLAPADFPMGLYLVQGVQLQDWRNAHSGGFARLISEVEARLGRGAGAGHEPPKHPGRIKAAPNPSQGKARILVFAAVALVLAAAAGTGLMMQMGKADTPSGPVAAPETAASDVATPPAPAAVQDGNLLSKRLVGRWHWEGQACKDGTEITLTDGKLTFVTGGGTPFVHAVEADTDKETRTRVLSPDFVLGEQYSLTPEYVATSDARNFQLIVKNLTSGKDADRWYPCEVN